MLLRVIPNEHISLKFPEELDTESSDFSYLQYVGFDGNCYHFINTSNTNYVVKFKFTNESELVVPVEVYINKWQICSPFELIISRLFDNVQLAAVNWYNDYFLRYKTQNNQITFENNTENIYRLIVGGKQCFFEQTDRYGTSLFSVYVNDTRSRLSFILKPKEKLVVSVNNELVFRSEKAIL